MPAELPTERPGRPSTWQASGPPGAAALSGPCGLVRLAGRVLPLREGDPCGDATACFEGLDAAAAAGEACVCLLAVVDGLGHGAEAATAADAALGALGDFPMLALPELMARLDERLQATRGAAVGLVRIAGTRLLHAGVGNTRVLRWRAGSMARLPSQNGIVGGGLPQPVNVNAIDLQPGDWLLMFTDGIQESVQLPLELPEWRRDPGLLCEHLLARWRNVRDDSGVLVGRVGAG